MSFLLPTWLTYNLWNQDINSNLISWLCKLYHFCKLYFVFILLESFTYKEIAIGIDSVAIGECKKALKGLEKKKNK